MTREPDLFELYRWLLAVACTVYTLIHVARSLLRWLAYFQESRRKVVLGHYAGVLLLRARLRPFLAELWQIGGLLAVLGVVLYGHHRLMAG